MFNVCFFAVLTVLIILVTVIYVKINDCSVVDTDVCIHILCWSGTLGVLAIIGCIIVNTINLLKILP